MTAAWTPPAAAAILAGAFALLALGGLGPVAAVPLLASLAWTWP